jgi:spore coat protein U-like protein
MSSLKLVRLAAVTAAALLSCSFASALDSQNMTVNATVPGICKLQTMPTMAFTLDPSAAANGNATATVSYKCTKGTSGGVFKVGNSSTGTYTSGTTQATGALAGGTSSDLLQYSITWTVPGAYTGSGFGTGSTANPIVLTGEIANAQFANAAADTYTNTVAIEINP